MRQNMHWPMRERSCRRLLWDFRTQMMKMELWMWEHLKSTWSFKVQAGWNCQLSHLISYSPFQRLRSKSKACLIRRSGWRTCLLLGPSQELLELSPAQQLESLERLQVLDPPQLETTRNWRWPRGWHSRSTLRRTWGPRLRYLKPGWFLVFFICLL